MNSSGKIVSLVNPTNAQDAATKSYVDTEFGSSGILVNRPTVERADTENNTHYLTFIPPGDLPSSTGANKRALLRCDGSGPTYNPSTNSLTVSGNLSMNSTGRINNLVNPSSAQDAATKSYVDTSIPIGGIIMWSGSNSSLPSNWKFCDGENGTPDLRGRFVMCTNRQLNGDLTTIGPLNYWANMNTTGGSPHAVVVSHSHAVTWSGGIPPNIYGSGSKSWPGGGGHSDGTSLTINSEGVSGTNQNIPQHYVLAYIMRIS